MPTMLEPMMSELDQEAATTKRLLQRVPADQLTWRPHRKSMTLGQLALHVAMIPGALSKLAQLEEFDSANANFDPPQPQSTAEICKAFEESLSAAHENLKAMTDASAGGTWRMGSKGREVLAMPRVTMLRGIMLNHWYHHRGQLSVYLRMLDVPIPVIYGRSADENPFA